MQNSLESLLDKMLRALAREFAVEGAATEVAVLSLAEPKLNFLEHDNIDGGVDYFELSLPIAAELMSQLKERKQQIEDDIGHRLEAYRTHHRGERIKAVSLVGDLKGDPSWRENAKKWIKGEGITNQGRVRSTNVASRKKDGLLFRSEPEIYLYQSLKAIGVCFAPLPVFLKGGPASYQRIEPDFIIIKDGVVLQVEVDGDTVHHETPAEAHARVKILMDEGVHLERIKAKDCDTEDKADACAKKLIAMIEKHKSNRA